MPMCPTHNKELRQNRRGWYCPTKVGEGWCQYKPGDTPAPRVSTTPGANVGFQKTPSDWERKVGKQKALCGMVNGLFAGGMKPSEITPEVMMKLSGILSNIETASGVPASKPVKSDEPPIESYEEPGVQVEDIPY